MKIATAADMKRIDERAVREHGLTVEGLMGSAGAAVVRSLQRHWGKPARLKIGVLCGRGHNGGDGFVVARLLKRQRADVTVVLASNPEDFAPETGKQYRKARAAGIRVLSGQGRKGLDGARKALASCDVLVDALLGTGTSRPVEGAYRELILLARDLGAPVLAVDVPSGISSDTGEILGEALPARVTVTFGLPKPAFFSHRGAALSGIVEVADIGFSRELLQSDFLRREIIEEGMVREVLPVHDDFIHKGDRGRLLIVAGSTGLTGAATLCALAAQRIGTGLVTVACPKSLNAILEMKLTEPMTAPLPEIEGGFLAPEALEGILRLAGNADAVVIGPGLGREPGTGELLQGLLPRLGIPMILDADGLNLMASDPRILRNLRAPAVLTPHPGEAARLLGRSTAQVEQDRVEVARQLAGGYNGTAVLKGRFTVVAGPSDQIRINSTGSRSLATAGTGDVLAGMIGGLLAQRLTPFNAATAGVYLHGRAGEEVGREVGPDGALAGDLLPFLPRLLKGIVKGRPASGDHPRPS